MTQITATQGQSRLLAISHRARELMLLRVAWRTRAQYEWVHHVRLAERYGLTPHDVAAIATGTCESWTPLEHDLIAATDQLLDQYRIEADTWNRLAAALDERQLVELPFIVGTYTCLAMAFNSWCLQAKTASTQAAFHHCPFRATTRRLERPPRLTAADEARLLVLRARIDRSSGGQTDFRNSALTVLFDGDAGTSVGEFTNIGDHLRRKSRTHHPDNSEAITADSRKRPLCPACGIRMHAR